MPRLPLLDPRSYRLDDLLRRPFLSTMPVGSGGGKLSVDEAQSWGFSGIATFDGTTINAPLSLSVWIEGTPIFPANTIYRPSHITENSQDTESGLQVIEDKFVAENDVLVAVISLRNPGEYAASVEVRIKWGIARGDHPGADGVPFYVSRFAPNPESRRISLAGGGRARMIFALALAKDDAYARSAGETAQRRASTWAGDTSAVITQGEQFQKWADKNVPRFDCPDPWCLRAWYHAFHLRRKYPTRHFYSSTSSLTLANLQAVARQHFENGDYDTLSESVSAFLPSLFLDDVLGMRQEGDTITFDPAPDLAQWSHFCVEDWRANGQTLTIVWDSLEIPTDTYDDGDKGFTVYLGDIVLHHQTDLAPCQMRMPIEEIFDEEGDD